MQSAVLERISLTVQAVKPTIVLDYSAALRLELWQRGLKAFLDNFVFGTGYWTTRWVMRGEAHSQYVAILIETGIVGFSVFCWLIVSMFRNAIRLMKKSGPVFFKSLGLGYIAGFTAVLTTCFFSETLEAFRMIGPLWFITGLIASANRLLLKEGEEEPE
jgi:O-antigen ligase